MVVRIPAVVVALALALALDAGTFALAVGLNAAAVAIVLLPLCASAGGFVAARWASRAAPAPGLAVGVLLVACQLGAAFGPYPAIQPLLDPRLLLLQLIAALGGGLVGMVLVRRAAGSAQPAPTLTPLS